MIGLWLCAPGLGNAQAPLDAEARQPSNEAQRSVSLHAPTLRHGEMAVGLWRVEAGLFDFLALGTSLPFWLAGIPFKTSFANGYLRAAIALGHSFTLGARVGFTYANLGRVYVALSKDSQSGVQSRLAIIPVSLTGTVHNERFALSVAATYTAIRGRAAALAEESAIGGIAFTDTLQLHANLSVRVAPQLALIGEFRYLPYHGPFLVTVDAAAEDGETRVRGALELAVEGLQHSWAALAGIHMTFGVFNMRLAAGWGSLFLQDLGLVYPNNFLQLDFDIYFRFQL